MVRKGEIACYKQFLFFSQCFPQLYTVSASTRYQLPKDKILDWSKFNKVAEDKLDVNESMKVFFEGKGLTLKNYNSCINFPSSASSGS